MENIIYDIRWSNNLDEKFINDFRNVCSTVFKNKFTREEFNRKFINNIYGPSVLVVVYIDDIPSAARALWRNDINNQEAYQPGDTCVMENCRGKGIFSIMTQKSIAYLPNTAIIYNFPNQNSYHGYIKMGWKLVNNYYRKLFLSYKKYKKEHPIKMSRDYAQWWISGRNLYYTKKAGHYFLLWKDHRPMCYHVFAETDKEIAIKFPHIRFAIFFYESSQKTWYGKYFAPGHVVSRNSDTTYIPIWKIDAI